MSQADIIREFDMLEAFAKRKISEGENPALYMYRLADITVRLAIDNVLESDFVIVEGTRRIERISHGTDENG